MGRIVRHYRNRIWLLAGLLLTLVGSVAATSAQDIAPVVTSESWLARQLTIPNILLLVGFVFHLGVMRQEWRALVARQANVEGKLEGPNAIFVRRDVLDLTLAGMRHDLDRLAALLDRANRRADARDARADARDARETRGAR